MLKIKDSVTIKQLKEFGFKKNIGGLYEMNIKNDKLDKYHTSLLIEPLYRNNKKEIVIYSNNKKPFEDVEEDVDLCIELDTLYDLIKADMVEKVEDN
jgi:hypothetical protein